MMAGMVQIRTSGDAGAWQFYYQVPECGNKPDAGLYDAVWYGGFRLFPVWNEQEFRFLIVRGARVGRKLNRKRGVITPITCFYSSVSHHHEKDNLLDDAPTACRIAARLL